MKTEKQILRKQVEKLNAKGKSPRKITQQLGADKKAVRKALRHGRDG